jgi:hypothetical protein
MSLALKIMDLYPSLKQHDFLDPSMIILQNDGDGDYIKKWNHPTLEEPIYDAINDVVYAPQSATGAAGTIQQGL